MTLQEHYKATIDYVAENIDRMEYEIALKRIDEWRCPLKQANQTLYNKIERLIDDYTLDNDLPQDWFHEFGDIEDIFWKILF